MSEINKELLALLDEVIAPNGVIDEKAFSHFFNEYGEDLSVGAEPGDEDELEIWQDATLKHQVFDYWPSKRENGLGNFPSGKNDLPWVLADHATYSDEEFTNGLLKELEKYLDSRA